MCAVLPFLVVKFVSCNFSYVVDYYFTSKREKTASITRHNNVHSNAQMMYIATAFDSQRQGFLPNSAHDLNNR
jgi:hypothetical protein